MKALALDPVGPFAAVPRSDTLFGALCWGIRRVHGEETLEDYLAQFADASADEDADPPFLISSAVPTIDRGSGGGSGGRDGRTYLLPRPRLPAAASTRDDPSRERIDALRAWERTEYLPHPLFADLLAGDRTIEDVLDGFEAGRITVDGRDFVRREECLLSADDPSRPFEPGERTRNAVNRLTGATDGQVFHRERVHFAPDAGLAVFATGDVAAVAEGLAAIQDRGIGGGRSVGNGQFELDGIRDLDLPVADEADDRICTLSLCVPAPDELETVVDRGRYAVETRKGVVENSLASPDGIWKRRVLALAEGSILPAVDGGGPPGHNPVVADHFEHGVQQYGYALGVGMG
jgi:CRISPR-associated protein Csm4